MKRNISEAAGICLIVACLIGLAYQADQARRFESKTNGYSLVFPFGWKALPQDSTVKAPADAYFGDGRGRSAAVFAHDESTEPRDAAESILSQAKSERTEVTIKERRRFQRDGMQFERLVFTTTPSVHHYTFVFKAGKQLVVSANCVKPDFGSYQKAFDSIADSLTMFPAHREIAR